MPSQLPIMSEDPFAALQTQLALLMAEVERLRADAVQPVNVPAIAPIPDSSANGDGNGAKRKRAKPGERIIRHCTYVQLAYRIDEDETYLIRANCKGSGKFRSGYHIATMHDRKEAEKLTVRIDKAIDFVLQSLNIGSVSSSDD